VALLAVLWVLAGAGTAVAVGLAAIRDGIATSRYRSEHTRARWGAEGCLAEFRAELERSLSNSSSPAFAASSDPWIDPRSRIPAACAIRLEPPPDGPVDLNAAPESALLALPGFDPEVVAVLLRVRAWGRRLGGLDQLMGEMPAELREGLAAHYAELIGRAAFTPPAWVVTGEGRIGGRSIPVLTERWVRADARVAIVRRELR
jgi:hypothetical protein